MKPGETLGKIIHKLTGIEPCLKCRKYITKMNDWGWLECFKRHEEIKQYLLKECRRRRRKNKDLVCTESLIESAYKTFKETK